MKKLLVCNIALLLLTGLLFSCHEKQDLRTGVTLDSEKKFTDSLAILDTLVMKYRTVNVPLAKKYARKSIVLSSTINSPEAIVKALNISGNAYSVSQMDSAFIFYKTALSLSDSTGSVTMKAKLFYNIAMLHSAAHDYRAALPLFDSSLYYSEKLKDIETRSLSFNSVGNIFNVLNDNAMAKKMYDSAFKVAQTHSFFHEAAIALGNLAPFENDQSASNRLRLEAISYLEKGRNLQEPLASMYINLANNLDNPDSSIYYFNRANKLISEENAPDTYIAMCNGIAYSYFDKGDFKTSESWIVARAIPLCLKTKNWDWLSTVYDTYADILKAEGKATEALAYEKKALESFQKSVRQSAAEQVRLLGAIMDLKNKEVQINRGRIEIIQAHSDIRFRNQLLLIVLLVFLITVAVLLFLVQRKRLQIQKNQITSARRIIEAEEREKSKISRDLHDLMGFKLTGLHDCISQTQVPDKSKSLILNLVNEIRTIIRDTSHRLSPSWLVLYPLDGIIKGLCDDCMKVSSIDVRFSVTGSFPSAREEIKIHLFRIVQELLNNAMKHAPESKIILDLSSDKKTIKIKYSDDGPGFDPEINNNGMGYQNIKERINLLQGDVELNTSPGYGTYYELEIPL